MFIFNFSIYNFNMYRNCSSIKHKWFNTKDISGVSDKSEYITMDEYNQIETGMSYDEVVDIIGSKGELSTKSESNGYTIEIYTWYGNGTAGSNANVTFENGKATTKAQVGLQ